MTTKRTLAFIVMFVGTTSALAQGVGIPSKKGGIGFGNLPHFTGVRLNFSDKNVEKINGINITSWKTKDESQQTGTMNGISIGLPIAMGTADMNGIGVGVFGVGASHNIKGLNVGGLGVGAGGSVKGINLGGLGVGSGGDLFGINMGGLGVGSGGNVAGINVGGLGVGSGGKLMGLNIGGLGVGSGGDTGGINIGGLGVGSGANLTGLSIGGFGVGSGQTVTGISIGGIGVGAGKSLNGLTIAGIGAGSPVLRGVVIAPSAGGVSVSGLMIVPAYFRVGGDKGSDEDQGAEMKGVSISAFNHIRGTQKGMTIGIFNYTYSQKGFQLGVLNYIKDNPKGLKLLPVFNTRF